MHVSTTEISVPEAMTIAVTEDTLTAELSAGQPKSRVQARIGASRAGLRPILSRSRPMDKSGLKFC